MTTIKVGFDQFGVIFLTIIVSVMLLAFWSILCSNLLLSTTFDSLTQLIQNTLLFAQLNFFVFKVMPAKHFIDLIIFWLVLTGVTIALTTDFSTLRFFCL